MKILKTLLFISALVFSSVAFAAWVPPKDTPPTCQAGDPGCDPPINVSANNQIKTGGLGLGNVASGDFDKSKMIIKDSTKLNTLKIESALVDDTGGSAVRAIQNAFNGIGVWGTGGFAGLVGSNNSALGAAVVALQGRTGGTGFFQGGDAVKNIFEGRVEVGNPKATGSATDLEVYRGDICATPIGGTRKCLSAGGNGGDSFWEQISNTQDIRNTNTGGVRVGTGTDNVDNTAKGLSVQDTGDVAIAVGQSTENSIGLISYPGYTALYEFNNNRPIKYQASQHVFETGPVRIPTLTGCDVQGKFLTTMGGPPGQEGEIICASPPTGGGVGGSGTANKVAKWLTDTTLGNSNITDTGSSVDVTGPLQSTAGVWFNNTDPTKSLFLTGAGNVGIGTTEPAAKLHVRNGNIAVTSANGQTTAVLAVDDAGNAALDNQRAGGTTRITANGNVILVPGNALIFNNLRNCAGLSTGADGKVSCGGGGGNQNLLQVLQTGSDASSFTGNTLIGGNVGIGTDRPAEKLDVKGNIIARNAGGGSGFVRLGAASGDYGDVGTIDWKDGSKLQFRYWAGGQAIDTMTLAGQNVGIGTEKPQYKLHVVGNIGASKLISPEVVSAGNSLVMGAANGAGANIELYNAADDIYYDADSHYFRKADGSGKGNISAGSINAVGGDVCTDLTGGRCLSTVTGTGALCGVGYYRYVWEFGNHCLPGGGLWCWYKRGWGTSANCEGTKVHSDYQAEILKEDTPLKSSCSGNYQGVLTSFSTIPENWFNEGVNIFLSCARR